MMPQTDPLGTVLREGDRIGFRFERALRQGASIELVFWPVHVEKYAITEPVLPGELRLYDPPTLLEFTWGGDVVRFDLAPDGEGTRLVLTTWLEDGEREAAYRTAAGYHVCLATLRELLDAGTVSTPLVDVDVSGAEAVYAGALGVAGP